MSAYGEITYECTFDAGHRIVGHKGKCARLHGHTYRVMISAAGKVHDPGFVVDFGDLKEMINEWDHMMLLWEEDPFFQKTLVVSDDWGILRLPFNPTAENMARQLAQDILFEHSLHWVEVKLWETPKCSATARITAR